MPGHPTNAYRLPPSSSSATSEPNESPLGVASHGVSVASSCHAEPMRPYTKAFPCPPGWTSGIIGSSGAPTIMKSPSTWTAEPWPSSSVRARGATLGGSHWAPAKGARAGSARSAVDASRGAYRVNMSSFLPRMPRGGWGYPGAGRARGPSRRGAGVTRDGRCRPHRIREWPEEVEPALCAEAHPGTVRRPMTRSLRLPFLALSLLAAAARADEPVRVFVFAGQSNMVGSDSKVADVERFPPFADYGAPQSDVRFWYCIGRENKHRSEGWVDLAPVNGIVGPELSFARRVGERVDAPIAIVKIAAGGTHLGGDWNPDEPSGFEMYPLALETVRAALGALDAGGCGAPTRGLRMAPGRERHVRGVVQGRLRREPRALPRVLASRPRRARAALLRRRALHEDDLGHGPAASHGRDRPRAEGGHCRTIPLAHLRAARRTSASRSVGGVGLALPLRHARPARSTASTTRTRTSRRSEGVERPRATARQAWPYDASAVRVKLFVLAGHRNMEGERAFVQHLVERRGRRGAGARPIREIAYTLRVSAVAYTRVAAAGSRWGRSGLLRHVRPRAQLRRGARRGAHGPRRASPSSPTAARRSSTGRPKGSEAKSRNLYPTLRTSSSAPPGRLSS